MAGKKSNNYPSIPLPELRAAFKEDPHSLVGKIPGIFLIDKHEGISSHGVVAAMRKKLGIRKVGHGGTLDPLATGLLIIFAGNATRLFDDLQDFHKSYTARLELGIRTDTYDITGEVIDRADVPAIDEQMLSAALDKFRGMIMQRPPVYSALKRNGVPLYELARKGIEVEVEEREVEVFNLSGRIISEKEIELEMKVSKGFYVRSLVDDLGRELGSVATMTRLRRTEIGVFQVSEAKLLENI